MVPDLCAVFMYFRLLRQDSQNGTGEILGITHSQREKHRQRKTDRDKHTDRDREKEGSEGDRHTAFLP